MQFNNFQEFYQFYLTEHSNKTNRLLHFIGCCLVLLVLVDVLFNQTWLELVLAPVFGYGCAWLGHFFCENNTPATFKHPWYSFLADWVMFKEILQRKISLF